MQRSASRAIKDKPERTRQQLNANGLQQKNTYLAAARKKSIPIGIL